MYKFNIITDYKLNMIWLQQAAMQHGNIVVVPSANPKHWFQYFSNSLYVAKKAAEVLKSSAESAVGDHFERPYHVTDLVCFFIAIFLCTTIYPD